MPDSAPVQTITPAGLSASEAQAVQGVAGGVPVPISGTVNASTTAHATAAAPTYTEGTDVSLSVDLSGNLRVSGGAGGGGSSDVALHDNGTPANHLAINTSGQAAIQNPPNLDAASSTLAKESGGHLASLDTKVPAQGAAATASSLPVNIASDQNVPVKITDGTNTTTVKAASTAAGATDRALVVAVSPNNSVAVTGTFWQATQPVSATSLPLPSGAAQEHTTAAAPASVELSNGSAFYDARDQGAAAASSGAWPTKVTDGTTVTAVDPTFAAMRATLRPMEALGFYSVFTRVGSYTTTTAGSIVFSMRWGDATRKALLLKIELGVLVTGTVTAGPIERQVVIVRGFTASDTGGTAVTLTGNNAKLRTSFPASLVTDMRFGPASLVAGTGTADATALTGIAGVITAAGSGAIGNGELATVWDATDGGTDHPIVLSTNEGFRVRFGAAADAASTRETIVRLYWAEVNSY